MKKHDHIPFLTDAQLRAELWKCEYCEEKPCRKACPADCSPADFIMAARGGTPADFRRSAASILGANPLGGVCGVVCPDYFCVKACVFRRFNDPVKIPAVQATIVRKAVEAGLEPFTRAGHNGPHVAVIGAGPAGLGAAAVLAQQGYHVTIFEKSRKGGGMSAMIPSFRLPPEVLEADLDFVRSLGGIEFRMGREIASPEHLLHEGFAAVVVSTGKEIPISLGVRGEEHAVDWYAFLGGNKHRRLRGKRVVVIGGGAVAVDCATSAVRRGAASVEILYRRKQEHMPLTGEERKMILEYGIELSTCVKPLEIVHRGGRVTGIRLVRMHLPPGRSPRPGNFVADKEESPVYRSCHMVVTAIGNKARTLSKNHRGVFYAGELSSEAGTVVEAVASGKNAALAADAFLRGKKFSRPAKNTKSTAVLGGTPKLPVPLEAEFFGRKILSPILLSAAPHTDGYAQMRAAYERGWSGGIMKTAYDRVPIHIPGGYMFVFGQETYGNFDNVSGHQLDRMCREIEKLVREFPDRLTVGSTGGPVTGRDDEDRAAWQSNTRKLERAGAMGIEYSLSCPQGGDGTKGDLVSQDAETTAKIVDWVMSSGDPSVPKLFKLTAAVTAIRPIVSAIANVFARYPGKKAGVTLANSFPALGFRPGKKTAWDEGIIVGLSGAGITPISHLTLARVAGMGITVSANGGVMGYRTAANFLALGGRTVQCCTVVMKYGLGIVDELHSGLSFLMHERGFHSVRELIGAALPDPIRAFDTLSATKQIPHLVPGLCEHCGNCVRCPYLAVSLDRHLLPVFDPVHCIGCSLCVQKCFTGALVMRDRSEQELAVMEEGESR